MPRTSPRLIDLMIALASGGAGTYAISRIALADALPRVVIAQTSRWLRTTLMASHEKRNDWRFRDGKVEANAPFGRCERRIQVNRNILPTAHWQKRDQINHASCGIMFRRVDPTGPFQYLA